VGAARTRSTSARGDGPAGGVLGRALSRTTAAAAAKGSSTRAPSHWLRTSSAPRCGARINQRRVMDLADNSLNEVGKLDKKATGQTTQPGRSSRRRIRTPATASSTRSSSGRASPTATARPSWARSSACTTRPAQGLEVRQRRRAADIPAGPSTNRPPRPRRQELRGDARHELPGQQQPAAHCQLWPNQGMSAGAGGPNDASAIAGPGTFAYDKGTVPAVSTTGARR